jgi:hypothetical protein
MGFKHTEIETDLATQHFVVREYFTEICWNDPYGLDPQGFFKRVCNSIENNGVDRTAKIYEIDPKIVSYIKYTRK